MQQVQKHKKIENWKWVTRTMAQLGYIPAGGELAVEVCSSRNAFERAVADRWPAIEFSPAKVTYMPIPGKRESWARVAVTVWGYFPGVGSERWSLTVDTVTHLRSAGDRGRAAEVIAAFRRLRPLAERELRRRIIARLKADLARARQRVGA